MVCKFSQKNTTKCCYFFSWDNLPGLVSNVTLNAINQFERKISGKGALRVGKKFTSFISNQDIIYIFKIIKWLEDSGLLINRVTETVKHKIKN